MVHTPRQGATAGTGRNQVAAPAYGLSVGGVGKKKYYAVAKGHKVGIFDDWSTVQKLVDGFPGCKHKSFPSRDLAVEYLQANGVTVSPQAAAAAPHHNSSSHVPDTRAVVATAPPTSSGRQGQQYSNNNKQQASSSGQQHPQPSSYDQQLRQQQPQYPSGHQYQAQPQQHQAGYTSNAAPGEPYNSALPTALALEPPEGMRLPMVQVNEALVVDATRLYRLEFDGASRGNPGPAGAGAFLCQAADGAEVAQAYQYVGRSSTNNVAEYSALILGLKIARDMGIRRLTIIGDSELIIRQMEGRYRVNNERMKPLHAEACALRQQFVECTIEHVLREYNTKADALSNMALDN